MNQITSDQIDQVSEEIEDWMKLNSEKSKNVNGLCGHDSEGRQYTSLASMWKYELLERKPKVKHSFVKRSPTSKSNSKGTQTTRKSKEKNEENKTTDISLPWYGDALKYWDNEENCPPTIDGVLGGFGNVSPIDISGSRTFLQEINELELKEATNNEDQREPDETRVIDIGAGIGRITKELLLPLYNYVDLLEYSPRLINSVEGYIANKSDYERVTCFCQGMQEWNPPSSHYDVIWIQWCIGHLHDIDFIDFVQKCIKALKPNGFVVIKDNFCGSSTFGTYTEDDKNDGDNEDQSEVSENEIEEDDFIIDKEDSSLTRSLRYVLALIYFGGGEVIKRTRQMDFPTDLYPIHMIAFRGRISTETSQKEII